MSKILLSIKPEFADKIISGEKKFEYRTHVPIKDVNTIVIYSTTPVGKIIGEVQVAGVISGAPSSLWEKTKKSAGISRSKYREYFRGRKVAYAFELGEIKKFEKEIFLEDYGLTKAPQSFVYLEK
ncbi:MAG: ASCH domain-containing protein [Alphaproteobacteria bacterium]|nr:ASCH domain-containing protein [Alphaproteobacteria bacterium]